MKIIEITVSPRGETKVETRGFTGGACREASRFIEETLGARTAETPARRRDRLGVADLGPDRNNVAHARVLLIDAVRPCVRDGPAWRSPDEGPRGSPTGSPTQATESGRKRHSPLTK